MRPSPKEEAQSRPAGKGRERKQRADPYVTNADGTLSVGDVVLFPEGGLYHAASSTLIVGDLHAGFEASARSRGASLPDGDLLLDRVRRNVERAVALASNTGKKEDVLVTNQCGSRVLNIVINGDAKHDYGVRLPTGAALQELHQFLLPQAQMTYVRGNHDAGIDRLIPGARVATDGTVGKYRVFHGHEVPHDYVPGSPAILSHEHPSCAFRTSVGAWIRASVFLRIGEIWVLPALSPFTQGVNFAARTRFFGPALAGQKPAHAEVFALAGTSVLPFGRLSDLQRKRFV
ncbi:MAG: metallophosphoesterase [Thermoplasmatota archaeon]